MLGLAGLVAVPFLSQPSPPRFKDRNIVVQWDGPAGASLSEMDRITRRAVGRAAGAAVGLGRRGDARPRGQRRSDRRHELGSDLRRDQAERRLRQRGRRGPRRSSSRCPGMQASVSTYESDVRQGCSRRRTHDVTVRVYGEDYAQLHAARDAGPGADVRTSAAWAGRRVLRAGDGAEHRGRDQRQPRLTTPGVLPGDARRQASTLVSGLTVGNFFEQQAVFDVVVMGVPSVRAKRQRRAQPARSTPPAAGMCRLGSIASVASTRSDRHPARGAVPLRRRHRAGLRRRASALRRSAIQRELSRISFPLDYHAEIVGGDPGRPTSHTSSSCRSCSRRSSGSCCCCRRRSAAGGWRCDVHARAAGGARRRPDRRAGHRAGALARRRRRPARGVRASRPGRGWLQIARIPAAARARTAVR